MHGTSQTKANTPGRPSCFIGDIAKSCPMIKLQNALRPQEHTELPDTIGTGTHISRIQSVQVRVALMQLMLQPHAIMQ